MATTDTRDTKERLIDAAESLFGDCGIAAVSVRDITARAEANIAAVNYHFGSKEALFLSVLKRRMEPLNAERLRLLDLVEASAGDEPPALEEILHAFVEPTFRVFRSNPDFMKFVGQLHYECGSLADSLLATARFGELIARLRSALLRALPGSRPASSWWGMSFLMGAMIHTWMTGHEIETISGGEAVYGGDEIMVERLTRFSAAGFRAIADIGEEEG